MDETKMTEMPVNAQTLTELTRILQKYKAGKASIERRTVAAENWWKLRNQAEERKKTEGIGGFQAVSGWLHNVIVSKHADAIEAFPEPSILPREEGDKAEAGILSKIIPVILEQNEFEKTYSDCMWQKLKTGTGVYKVYWDADKLGGLGDIAIERVDLLNVFWEPGVRDIQDSRYFFHTSLEDNDELERQYPQLQGRLRGNAFMATKFVYDDSVPTDGKSTVIDVYYKKYSGGKKVLHYCKYVGDTLLYSTENTAQSMAGSEEMARALPGLYEHGLYPFVFDSLFPVEGSPCGYGFIDLCQNSQTQIDMMQTAFVKNTMLGATPRYFQRMDGAINEEEFLNLANPVIHVSGNLGEDSIRTVDYRPLSGNYLEMRTAIINELRETSGNTETSVGLINAGGQWQGQPRRHARKLSRLRTDNIDVHRADTAVLRPAETVQDNGTARDRAVRVLLELRDKAAVPGDDRRHRPWDASAGIRHKGDTAEEKLLHETEPERAGAAVLSAGLLCRGAGGSGAGVHEHDGVRGQG